MADSPTGTRTVVRGGREYRQVRALRVRVTRGVDRGHVTTHASPVIRVGAHPSNDVVLRDPLVSRSHLEIRATPDGFRLVDLASTNGSFVGALKLGEVAFIEAIDVDVGGTSLRVEPTSDEVEIAAAERTQLGGLVGASAVMRELFADIERVAATALPVLIEGESGTGKELVAEAVHAASARAAQPFVVVDCAGIAPSVIEAELFGHVRGAFSDARAARPGLLAQADGGTLFLDEIGELPSALQVKLLGALDRRSYLPLGSDTPRSFDARVVAATHRDLARAVNEGTFRADLFYRVAGARLGVPPLRERLVDLPLLVEHRLRRLAERQPGVPAQLSAVAMASLFAQPWPGNVRELFNAVERAVLSPAEAGPDAYAAARDRFAAELEAQYLASLVEAAQGNLSEASRLSGIERRNLARLLRAHGLARRPR